ncbi:hypothetical protein [Nocardia farcinica]|uniref:hypothetical protein n=1 Tax=Nocardia farcinica TaxID=37329 RepID=UPI001895A317|nr:hypothetical protein [Nocardia farcinica]MBF6374441.1 hypothetical protein [Nocardia farcinica]
MLHWNRSYDLFSTTLSTSVWTRRNGSTNPLTSGGILTTNTSTGFFPAEYVAVRTSGPDQYMSATIGALHSGTSGGSPSALVLRSPNSATSGTVAVLLVKNAQIGIYTMTSWAAAGLTARAPYANANGGANLDIGGKVEFFVLNNTYYGLYQGSVVVSWEDTGLIVNQAARYGAVVIQRASDGSATGQMGFDNFTFGDLRPTDIANPQQAVARSSSF